MCSRLVVCSLIDLCSFLFCFCHVLCEFILQSNVIIVKSYDTKERRNLNLGRTMQEKVKNLQNKLKSTFRLPRLKVGKEVTFTKCFPKIQKVSIV